MKDSAWLNSCVLVDEPRRRRSMSSVCCSSVVVVLPLRSEDAYVVASSPESRASGRGCGLALEESGISGARRFEDEGEQVVA